jgi:demethylmacrocin O-methyltransferase
MEGQFDIIIDDGSHLSQHQLFSFYQTFPCLKDGGIYIEDVQTSFWPGKETGTHWDGSRATEPEFRRTCYGEFLELAKYLNHAEFVTFKDTELAMVEMGRQIIRIAFEHNMIIVWKGSNEQPSNLNPM